MTDIVVNIWCHTNLDRCAINKTNNKLMSMGSFHCSQKQRKAQILLEIQAP